MMSSVFQTNLIKALCKSCQSIGLDECDIIIVLIKRYYKNIYTTNFNDFKMTRRFSPLRGPNFQLLQRAGGLWPPNGGPSGPLAGKIEVWATWYKYKYIYSTNTNTNTYIAQIQIHIGCKYKYNNQGQIRYVVVVQNIFRSGQMNRDNFYVTSLY